MDGAAVTTDRQTPATRVAPVALLAVPLVLLALLLAARPAQAATPSPAGPSPGPFASVEELEIEPEEELEEAGGSDCEEAHEEVAEGEITAAEAQAVCEVEAEERQGQTAGSSSGECPLRSAHAHAATNDRTLKLTLGYTAYKPFQAELQLSHHLGTFKRHLGRAGVLRFTRQLGHRRLDKLALKLRPVGVAGCPSRRLVLFPE
jgi:hypothetical protein